MKPLRWLGASLLALLGSVLGLVGALLCVTLILAPLGIPILFLARRLFKAAAQLVVPRSVRHPAQTLGDTAQDVVKGRRKSGKKVSEKAGKSGKELSKKARKSGKKVSKKARKSSKRARKRLPVGS